MKIKKVILEEPSHKLSAERKLEICQKLKYLYLKELEEEEIKNEQVEEN